MNNQSKRRSDVWKQVAIYPVHFACHIAARFLLFITILATMLTPVLLLLLISYTLVDSLSETQNVFVRWIKAIIDQLSKTMPKVVDIARVFGGIGLFSFLVKREDFVKPLWCTIQRIVNVIAGLRLPPLNLRMSLSDTWQHDIMSYWPSIRDGFLTSARLIPATVILYICFLSVSPPAINVFQWGIEKTIDVWHETNTTHVVFMDSGPKRSLTDLVTAADKYSLVYREGNLKTKKGICPDSSNLNWLDLFKASFSDSLDNKGERVKLRVQGFASRAPVAVNDSIEPARSNTLNLQIANERAEAIVYYLTIAEAGTNKNSPCSLAIKNDTIRNSKNYDRSTHTWKGTGFDVVYKPWANYDSMRVNRPFKNPTKGKNRHLDTEFLNRSIGITIVRGNSPTKTTR